MYSYKVIYFILPKFNKHVIPCEVVFVESDVNRINLHSGGGYASYNITPRSES